MFPFGTKVNLLNLTPIPLPEPVEVEFTFIGGPFDGHKSVATVGAVLEKRFTVTMKNEDGKFLYRYAGDNTFQFESAVE